MELVLQQNWFRSHDTRIIIHCNQSQLLTVLECKNTLGIGGALLLTGAQLGSPTRMVTKNGTR